MRVAVTVYLPGMCLESRAITLSRVAGSSATLWSWAGGFPAAAGAAAGAAFVAPPCAVQAARLSKTPGSKAILPSVKADTCAYQRAA